MVKVRSFKGFLPKQALASQIVSPPYDVLNTEEARALAKGNETCFLRVSKPEIDLPQGTNLYSPEVYAKGRENLMLFRNQGWIREDSEERMYIYMQKMQGREQYGIMAMASVEDYENGLIKRHEFTIKRKEEDRTKLSDVQNANLGPVFLTFKGGEEIEKRMMEIVKKTKPYLEVHGHDDTDHVLWLCSPEDSAFLSKAFEKVPATYIADGHHRAASAFNVGKMRREAAKAQGRTLTGNEPFMFFMAIHYPSTNLKIMDYNRVLRSLNGMSSQEFLSKFGESYDIQPLEAGGDPKPRKKGECSLYIDKKWYRCNVKAGKVDHTNLVKMLDSQLLTDLVLTPVLGIQDIRSDERIDFVGGIRGLRGLVKRCDEDCVAAIALYPVQLDELMNIADAGMVMPPKSTWFEPKPRDGVVCRCFD
mmetsp:Transcript_4494/g.8215  ORF Transcript_4494/g.8215 Transcript_4494/m.8215 type:complete len:419 (-) Transcript_4494:864-2120(-)